MLDASEPLVDEVGRANRDDHQSRLRAVAGGGAWLISRAARTVGRPGYRWRQGGPDLTFEPDRHLDPSLGIRDGRGIGRDQVWQPPAFDLDIQLADRRGPVAALAGS